MDYQIISDSSCDLPAELAAEQNIKLVPFYVSFDGQHYEKDTNLDVQAFYQRMVDEPGVFPLTSLPTVYDYIEAFTPCVEAGLAVVCICITTKFSGSYNSAVTAKAMLEESHRGCVITVIDATVNTVLQGLLVLEAARMQRDGVGYTALVARIEQIKTSGRIFFTLGGVEHLLHGGRIGKLLSVVSGHLKIKPLIVLEGGEIHSGGISLNREKAKNKVVNMFKEHFEKTKEPPENYCFAVGKGLDHEEAVRFRDKLLQTLSDGASAIEIPIRQIGAAMGVHTGPQPLGIGLLKRYDR